MNLITGEIMRVFLKHLNGTLKQAIKYSVWHTEKISSPTMISSSICPFHFFFIIVFGPPDNRAWTRTWVHTVYVGADPWETGMKDKSETEKAEMPT